MMPDENSSAEAVELVGVGFHFEELPVGRRFRTLGRTITEADITAFVGVTGMVEDLFVDVEYAKASSLGGRAAPGALVYAFAEGLLLQSTMQRTGMAFLEMGLKVERPTLAGDTIHVVCEVTAARPTSKPGRGIVTTLNEVVNQRGEIVLTYSPTRMIRSRAR